MLIRDAEIDFATIADVRCEHGVVATIGNDLDRLGNESVIDARGCALLPSLHDHHLHFLSFAAARASVPCGPPQIRTEGELIGVLQNWTQNIGNKNGGWLRGIGYHPSVAGEIDRHWLDRHVGHVPVRLQHRSGRLWILNSLALAMLGEINDGPLEKIDGQFTGRLYDADTWLRNRLSDTAPDVRAASTVLASHGVTAFTDATWRNTMETADYFRRLQDCGDLLQDVILMGDASLDAMPTRGNLKRGAYKIHLHDNDLPDSESLCDSIRNSHAAMRPVAIHCVTLTGLLFGVDAFAQAGTMTGDRIEHASIAPPSVLQQIANLKLSVVTQPNFIFERGDSYLDEVDVDDIPWLYRLRGFIEAGIPLAAGTDAPFGEANPWRAMQAGVMRRTRNGNVIGASEALAPEAALALFRGASSGTPPTSAYTHACRTGTAANLVLLDRPWRKARENLSNVQIVKTIKSGEIIWERS